MDVPIAFDELWQMKEERIVDGIAVNLVSVRHLIKMKEYANRKQDIDDAILLSKLLKNEWTDNPKS